MEVKYSTICISNNACSLPQNIHVVAYHFVASDNHFELFEKLSFINKVFELIGYAVIKIQIPIDLFEDVYSKKH